MQGRAGPQSAAEGPARTPLCPSWLRDQQQDPSPAVTAGSRLQREDNYTHPAHTPVGRSEQVGRVEGVTHDPGCYVKDRATP